MTTLLCARALQPSLATMRHMLPSVRLCAPASQRLDAFCTQKAVAARSPCSQQQRWNHQHPPYSPIPSREEVAQWYETLRLLPGASPKQFKDAYRISAQRLNTDHDRSRDWVEFAKVNVARDGLREMMQKHPEVLDEYVQSLLAVPRKKAAAPSPNPSQELAAKWRKEDAAYKAWSTEQEKAKEAAVAKKQKRKAGDLVSEHPATARPEQARQHAASSTGQGRRETQADAPSQSKKPGVQANAQESSGTGKKEPLGAYRTEGSHNAGRSQANAQELSSKGKREPLGAYRTEGPHNTGARQHGDDSSGAGNAEHTRKHIIDRSQIWGERTRPQPRKAKGDSQNPRVVILHGLPLSVTEKRIYDHLWFLRPGPVAQMKLSGRNAWIEFYTAIGASKLQRLVAAQKLTILTKRITDVSLHNSPLQPPPTNPFTSRVLFLASHSPSHAKFIDNRKELEFLLGQSGINAPIKVEQTRAVFERIVRLEYASWRGQAENAKAYLERAAPGLKVTYAFDHCQPQSLPNVALLYLKQFLVSDQDGFPNCQELQILRIMVRFLVAIWLIDMALDFARTRLEILEAQKQ